MHGRVPFFGLFVAVALIVSFLVGYKFGDLQKLTASLIAATSSGSNASSSAPAVPTLADILQKLQDQEQLVAIQVADLRDQLDVINLKTTLVRTLKRGDSGDDVSKLQELLGNLPDLYPPEASSSDIITGYYGRETEAAVKKFQDQSGLKQTGILDQDTKSKLFELSTNSTADGVASNQLAPIDFSNVADLQNLQDQISQLVANEANDAANISDLQDQIAQINLAPSPAPQPASAPAPAPSPALSISSVQSSNITQSSATITWTTNNPSTSEVDYSLNSSLPSDQTGKVSSATMVTSHSISISHLSSATKYYYRVLSQDNTGSTASGAILSFTTTH